MSPYVPMKYPEKEGSQMGPDGTVPVASISSRDMNLRDLPPMMTARAQVLHPNGFEVVELRTDSRHLLSFFEKNWRKAPEEVPVTSRIYALEKGPEFYGYGKGMSGRRWYCEETASLVVFDCTSYTTVKVSVRGLLSQVRTGPTMWLHGTPVSLRMGDRDFGLLLLGCSGGGKTTLTSRLRRMHTDAVQVVNDDWGAVCTESGSARFTGESRLHMKYMSVGTLRPDLKVSPRTHPSEHYSREHNPVSRLLITPAEVFGPTGVRDRTPIDLIVLVRREAGVAEGVRVLDPERAVSVLRRGEYSRYYGRREEFFNGSLFNLTEKDMDRNSYGHMRLFDKFPVVELGNVQRPEVVTGHLLDFCRRFSGKPAFL